MKKNQITKKRKIEASQGLGMDNDDDEDNVGG
jgi:hypothetical protein